MTEIIAAILGAFASSAFWFFQRRWDARDTFRIRIAMVRNRLSRSSGLNFDGLRALYIATVDEVASAIFSVGPYLCREEKRRAEDLLNEYQGAHNWSEVVGDTSAFVVDPNIPGAGLPCAEETKVRMVRILTDLEGVVESFHGMG